MNTEFFSALDILEKEKGIPKEYMLEKVEAGTDQRLPEGGRGRGERQGGFRHRTQ